jgi:Ca-activated chloride channel homolog
VPAMTALGLANIATLELAYVELPALVEQVVTLPITVNIVPGDEATGRIPHPTVHSEVLFQEAQDVKRQASEAWERGEFEEGQGLWVVARDRLAASLEAAPEDLRAEIRAELDEVERMHRMSTDMGARSGPLMSKMSRSSYHRMNRKRGRIVQPEPEEESE